jgi:DNA-binding NtrC family response regulator
MNTCPLCGGRLAGVGSSVDAIAVRIPPTGMPLEQIERQAVVEALRMSKWVQKDAAKLLHISARVMNYKVKTLGIEIPRKGRAMVEPERPIASSSL